MYNEKVLNAVQIGLPGFSAMYHYTKFGMASPQGGAEPRKGTRGYNLRPGNTGRCSGKEQRPVRALRSTVYRKSIELIGSLSAACWPWPSQVGSRYTSGCVRTTHECLKRRERGLMTTLAWRAIRAGTVWRWCGCTGHLKHGVGMTSTRDNGGREVIGHHETLSCERQPRQCHWARQLLWRTPMAPPVGGGEEAYIELTGARSAIDVREGVVDNREMSVLARRTPVHSQPGNENIGATRRSTTRRAGRDAHRRSPVDAIGGGGQQEIIVS